MTNTDTIEVYCYNGPKGTDPHEVVVLLSREDAATWETALETGATVGVVDQRTGARWDIASAPCGLGCRCAAMALPSRP